MNKVLYALDGSIFTVGDTILEYSYLLAAIFFVIGLKLQSHPTSARKGNIWAGAGMLLAMITTLLLHKNNEGQYISMANASVVISVIIFGSIIGSVVARKVKMTAMPQLVSFYNATGGAASGLVAIMEFYNPENEAILVTLLGLVIGSLTFSGSMIAYGKLDGKVGDIFSPIMKYVNITMMLILAGLVIFLLTAGFDFPYRNVLSHSSCPSVVLICRW